MAQPLATGGARPTRRISAWRGLKGGIGLGAAGALAIALAGCTTIEESFFPNYELPESAGVDTAPYPRLADNPPSVTPEEAARERERGAEIEEATQVDVAEIEGRAARLGEPAVESNVLQRRAASIEARARRLLQGS